MSDYILTTDGELYHYGVKGMKWGVRKAQKLAKKDAKEFARAKMFYGEGAGNRRKLIKATVQQRSKDPVYKKCLIMRLKREASVREKTLKKRLVQLLEAYITLSHGTGQEYLRLSVLLPQLLAYYMLLGPIRK